MKNCAKKILCIIIVLILAAGLFSGCRQSPRLERIRYSDASEKARPDDSPREDKQQVPPSDNPAQNTPAISGDTAVTIGTGQGDSDLLLVITAGGIETEVPESVANVTTVCESTKSPHWKSSNLSGWDVSADKSNADQFSGRRIYTWADGDRYDGEWRDGYKEGQGTYTWADGESYSGVWRSDMFDGQGTYTWITGSAYQGEWKAGVKEGQGTYTWANGDKYTGGWAAGVKEGQGTYTWADGSVYEGEWKYGIREGRGIYRGADGTVYDGLWANGKFTFQ